MPLDKDKFVLLIWELWPEDLTLFLISPGTLLAELARLSNGYYINEDNLSENHPIFLLDEKLNELRPCDHKTIKDKHITAIYRCGWYL